MVSNGGYAALENSYSGGPLSASDLAVLKTTLAANSSVLQLVRRARSQPRADWGLKARPPVMTTFPPPGFMNVQRDLAALLRWDVLYQHAAGNDRDAIERIRDILRQSDAIGQSPAVMITHLSQAGIAAMGITAAQQIAPDLQIEGDPAKTTPASRATRQQVKDLIDGLLDESAFRQAAIHSWHGERMSELDTIDHLGGRLGLPQQFRLVEPMFRLDGLREAAQMSQAAAATAEANRPAAQAKLPHRSKFEPSELEAVSHLWSQVMLPSLDREIQEHFRCLTERRAAAIQLAIRLYRIDHRGKYPHELNDLAPQYLPGVPTDPMATGSRHMNYRPDTLPPVIYSVGENGVDEDGTSLPTNAAADDRWQKPDAVFPLEPPAAPAATQPSVKAHDHQ